MTTQSNKKKKREILVDNPFEAVGSLANDVADTMTNDVMGGIADSAISQIFGNRSASQGELKQNEETSFSSISQEMVKAEGIHSFQRQRESLEQNVFSYKESVQLQKTIEQLLKEIKKLAHSTGDLSAEVKMVAMEEMPVNPGKYHVNFFEWLLSIIKSLREKVEDSRSWLSVFQSKKKQRQYWSMFKKHGTSFGLSNERSLATQVG